MSSSHHTVANCDNPEELPKPVQGEAASTGGVVRIFSRVLFSGAREVEIEHKGAVYRLRQTSLGKLILTK